MRTWVGVCVCVCVETVREKEHGITHKESPTLVVKG
jgi:hypothetical protein